MAKNHYMLPKNPSPKSGTKERTISGRILNPKTGQYVNVMGLGALKEYSLNLKKNVDLTKPIAKQTLVKSGSKRKAG